MPEIIIEFDPRDKDIVWRNLRDFPKAGANVGQNEVSFTGRGDPEHERGAIHRLQQIFCGH